MNNMLRKTVRMLLTFPVILAMLIPSAVVFAAGAPPTSISAPENFAASNYGGAAVQCTLSAPDDLRALIVMTDQERGYHMKILGQVDFKTDNGSWHYNSDWDNTAIFTKYSFDYYNALIGGDSGQFLGQARLLFRTTFPNEKNVPVPAAFNSWEWYKTHSITLRARFAIDFGNKNIVFSDWSNEYVLSNNSKMNYKKILNENAPTLVSSKIITKGTTNVPWVVIQMAQHSDQMQLFNAAANNSVRTEVWLRKNGDKDFKNVGSVPFCNEIINLNVNSYFGKTMAGNYDAQAYEVKVRYQVDERAYQQSGSTAYNLLYSNYSNLISYNMPEWSAASKWAAPELQKASDMGLIPDILKGQDLTKSITREEFAEVALLVYQKATGITDTAPVSPNPFKDTSNLQVLKGNKLGIVLGYSPTEFRPKELINREQVAAMLVRTIKLIAPDADYSTAGAPVFSDQKDISNWALNDCLCIAKLGIITGSDGKFMPRAISQAQKALGYANTSREQALAMSVRTVEKVGRTN